MAPNPPACSLSSTHRWRDPARQRRLIAAIPFSSIAPLSAFEICGYVAPLPSLQENPSSGTVVLVEGVSLRVTPKSFITRIVRDRLVGKQEIENLAR